MPEAWTRMQEKITELERQVGTMTFQMAYVQEQLKAVTQQTASQEDTIGSLRRQVARLQEEVRPQEQQMNARAQLESVD